MKDSILRILPPDYPWKDRFYYVPAIDSTNDRLKQLARQGVPHGTVLLAGYQTAGHGRLGRSFHSPADAGIYMSILLRPDCLPGELMHLTCAAAVAMCDAVEQSCGFRPRIKWTNDLVSGRSKLGGILTELAFTSAGKVDYAIIGIGMNCCQSSDDFPSDIRDIAASLSMVTGKRTDRAAVAAAMIDALWRMDAQLLTNRQEILARYRNDCMTLGQDISLIRGEEIRHGTALSIDDAGALIVRFSDGHTESVSSGEVSVRGMYGYI